MRASLLVLMLLPLWGHAGLAGVDSVAESLTKGDESSVTEA